MTTAGDRVKVPDAALRKIVEFSERAETARAIAQAALDVAVLSTGMEFGADYIIRLDPQTNEFVAEAKA